MSTSADANAAQITELYRTVLGRNPDPGSVDYWDSTGLSVDQVKAELEGARDAPGSAENLLFSKNQAILKDINGLAKDKEISLTDIVKYANSKKLSFDDVAMATGVAIPTLTKDVLQFEQDRQNLAKTANDKGEVSLIDAIRSAASSGISNSNLAKFFNLTPQQFAQTVEKNALALGTAKLFDDLSTEAVANITGASKGLLDAGKFDATIYEDLGGKKNKEGQITVADALGVATKHGLTDAQIAPYIGLKEADITSYRTNTNIQTKIADAQKSDNQLTLDEILGIQKDADISLDAFVNQFFGGTDQEKSSLKQRLVARDALPAELKVAQDAITKMADAKTGNIDLSALYDYAQANNLSANALAPLVNLTPDALNTSFTDVKINRNLQNLSKDGLTTEEIISQITANEMPIEDFVNRYLSSDNKQNLINSIKTELSFTPEERAVRTEFAAANAGSIDKALSFAAQKGISDQDAARILGLNPDAIGKYRRSEFVTQGLNTAMGDDNKLDYNEIYQFSKSNNVPIDELINYLGEPDKRDALKTDLQKYIEGVEADARMSPKERLTQQLGEITSNGSRSGVWDKNNGWDHHLNKMVNYLESYGINDLRQIGTKEENRMVTELAPSIQGDDFRQADESVQTETPFVVYFDKVTGKELHAVPKSENGGYWEFGSEGQGKGSTGYFIGPTKSGAVGVTSSWREKYGTKEYALPLMFVAAIAAPYLLPEVIGTATGMTAAEAASLGLSANTGLAGMLAEAGMSIPAAQAAATVIAKGVYQGIATEMAGGDFNKGFIAGGVAPWVSQYATDWAANQLPQGTNPAVARSVGLAVGQLMTTGEIDPRQLAINAVAPQVMQKVVDATNGAITANQAKLLFSTLASGGQNITAMANNPLAVLNFVQQNRGLFDEILTNKPISEIGKKLNISALDNTQQQFFTQDGAIQYPGSRFESVEYPQVAGELVPGIFRTNSDGSITVGTDKETGLEVRMDPDTKELYTSQTARNEAGNQILVYSSRYVPFDEMDISKDVPPGIITKAKEIKASNPLGLGALLSPSTSLAQTQTPAGLETSQSTANVQVANQGQSGQQAGPAAQTAISANVLGVSPETNQALVTDANGKPMLVSTLGIPGAQSVQAGQKVLIDANGKILGVAPGATDGGGALNGITGVTNGPGSGPNAGFGPGVATPGITGPSAGLVTPGVGPAGGPGATVTPGGNGPGFVVTPSGGGGPGLVISPIGGTPVGDVGPGGVSPFVVTPGGGGPVTLTPTGETPLTPTGTPVTTPTGTPVTTGGGTLTPGGGSPVGPGSSTRPSIPGFYLPTGGSQQTQYIDYDQPTVGAPLLPEYYGLAAPDYLRPTDIGPFGLEAIIGALNATQQGNGSNQSQQNAAGQGQAAKG